MTFKRFTCTVLNPFVQIIVSHILTRADLNKLGKIRKGLLSCFDTYMRKRGLIFLGPTLNFCGLLAFIVHEGNEACIPFVDSNQETRPSHLSSGLDMGTLKRASTTTTALTDTKLKIG